MRNHEKESSLTPAARRRIRGQGMTEYIIVVALVAIAAVAAVSFFGAAVKGQFVQLGGELLGERDDTGIAAAREAGEAAGERNGASSLSDYGNAGGAGGGGGG